MTAAENEQSDLSFLLGLEGEAVEEADTTPPPSAFDLLPLDGIETEQTPSPAQEALEPFDFFQPADPPVFEDRLDKIGLLRDISGTELTVRTLNGREETFPLSSTLESFPPLTPGALVSFRLENRQVAEIAVPVVETIFEGALVVIEDDVLGLVSAAGERKVTQLTSEKIASLGLELGQTLQVFEFEGISTKVICSPQTGQQIPIAEEELAQSPSL